MAISTPKSTIQPSLISILALLCDVVAAGLPEAALNVLFVVVTVLFVVVTVLDVADSDFEDALTVALFALAVELNAPGLNVKPVFWGSWVEAAPEGWAVR